MRRVMLPGPKGPCCVYASLVMMILPLAATAQDAPWHLQGWGARASVSITKAVGAGVDTAGVRVLCQGRARADASDYRVVDGSGNPVPFQVTYHDPLRYSLISFRASNPQGRFFIYFDNPNATRAPEQVVADPSPGAGAPKGAWVPRHGLVYATAARPEGDNPKTVQELKKLMAASPTRFGAQYQRSIADGYNPFGPSDLYISSYRGWITLPASGKYAFCTASNEASFSLIDGRELVHWPGRHTVERGERGEKNVSIDLQAGLHYIEYYHEEVYLQQMAFLGWRPPGATEPGFTAVPESAFTAPHHAEVARYETPGGALVCFEPAIVDSIWPAERHEGQYTRCVFRIPAPVQGAAYRWDFGDGQTGEGATAEHVYLAPGVFQVKVACSDGGLTAGWPLFVYPIQHVTETTPEGALPDYLTIARTYDRARLGAVHLKELAHLFAENGAYSDALATGREFVERFGAANADLVPSARLLMAECALRTGSAGIDEAIANYQAAADAETVPRRKLDALAKLIQLVGVERGMLEKAEALFTQVQAAAKGAGLDPDTIAAYRRAVIASGDARLWNGQADGALDLYRKAEAMTKTPIPPQVRAARIGAYPNALGEFVAEEDHAAALDIVDQWEDSFPADKCGGRTLFWRGKLLALGGEHNKAARHLGASIRLGVGADFEAEARWLLAQSLEQLGRADEARQALKALAATGLTDPFAALARQKLQGGSQ
jgi:TolA-binding protein